MYTAYDYHQSSEFKVILKTSDEYRTLSKVLHDYEHELAEEKTLRGVIRGIAEVTELHEIRDELTEKGFNIIDIL